jgi:Holliday junction resolvasome RuvABC ATP-dependent DNA helicase subunit
MNERFVTQTIHDKTLDVSLRPPVFADFAGQPKVEVVYSSVASI